MGNYIAADVNLIHGLGSTADEALADALNIARQADLIDFSEGAVGEIAYPRVTLAEWREKVKAFPCTDALAQSVRDRGGAVAFRLLAEGVTGGTWEKGKGG